MRNQFIDNYNKYIRLSADVFVYLFVIIIIQLIFFTHLFVISARLTYGFSTLGTPCEQKHYCCSVVQKEPNAKYEPWERLILVYHQQIIPKIEIGLAWVIIMQ